MKAVSGTLPPEDDEGWAYEIKWDGMRLLAYVDPGGPTPLRLQTTHGLDAAGRWPELADLVDAVSGPAVLDGEVVALDESGRSDFGRLQTRQFPVTFIVFDLLWFDGNAVVGLPYLDRRRLLMDVVDPGDEATPWRVPAHLLGAGHTLFEQAKTAGLEGLVAKRIDSPYLPGKRSPAWRKVKVRRGQEMVVGGWLPGEGNRAGALGALLVGHYDDTGLRYAGRVGTGFDAAELARLQPRLDERTVDQSPFADELPAPVRKTARFVRPELVVQVEFAEWTTEGRLRHPAYIAERDDKDPHEVVREP